MMPGSIPHDMDCGVAEVEISTSQNHSKAGNTNNMSAQTSANKRQHGEIGVSPNDLEANELRERLKKHKQTDDNPFGILSVLSQVDFTSTSSSSTQVTQGGSGIKNNNNDSGETTSRWCPPIFIFNVNIKALVDTLRQTIPKFSFKVKNMNKNKSKIFFSDPSVHSSMMALLREKGIHSYSFTPKELKQPSFILRGLTADTEIKDIKEELDEIIPDTVANVAMYKTQRNSNTGLFLVSLFPGKNLSDISGIRGLLSQIVSWEKPRRTDSEIQCRRCQRWGHIAKNCNSMYKCVKCDQKHEPGECQRTREDSSDPYCTNCGEVGHPANWRGCPTYRKYVAARRQRVAKAIEERSLAKNNVNRAVGLSMVTPGHTFSNLFHTRPAQLNAQPQKPPVIDQFLKLASIFLESEELTLEQEINIFLSGYPTMPKTEAKNEFLRLLNKIRINYGP